MNLVQIVLATLICIWSSVIFSEECKVPSEGYDLLSIYPPEMEAAMEVKKPNPQFLGILNYSLVIPGISGDTQCMSKEKMVKVIPGTTDTPCSEALDIYQLAAIHYARAFNKELLVLLPSSYQRKCGVKWQL